MADVVLLHGTTQSPQGWQLLVTELARRGHRAHTPDLPSGDHSADDYAALVAQQLPPGITRPVVVAHSGAGLLLSTVAAHLGAERQVWLAAVIPDPERSLTDEIHADPEAIFNPEWMGQDPVADHVGLPTSCSTTATCPPCDGPSGPSEPSSPHASTDSPQPNRPRASPPRSSWPPTTEPCARRGRCTPPGTASASRR